MSFCPPRRPRPDRRCCCCTAPAAMSTTCCRCVIICRRRGRALGTRNGPGERHAAVLPPAAARASSMKMICVGGPTSWPSSCDGQRRLRDRGPLAGRRGILQWRQHCLGDDAAAARSLLAGAVLLAAMVPFAEPPAADLSGTMVIISNGARDPMITPQMTDGWRDSCGARCRGGRTAAPRRPSDRSSRPAADP